MNKTIVTTSWDDGHILDLTLAALLRKYHLAGTFYIAPEDREIAPELRLTPEQIVELGRDFEIGGHTVTHPRLSQVDDATAQNEITGSKTVLENILGREIKTFCYPGGDYLPRHEQMVRDAGFTSARTVKRFATDAGADRFAVPTTIHAYRHWSDAAPIMRNAGVGNFMKQYLNWDDLAIAMFDKNPAVFHLWGHSWEIEKNNDWDRLERVFKHIANRSGVTYATNGELIK